MFLGVFVDGVSKIVLNVVFLMLANMFCGSFLICCFVLLLGFRGLFVIFVMEMVVFGFFDICFRVFKSFYFVFYIKICDVVKIIEMRYLIIYFKCIF